MGWLRPVSYFRQDVVGRQGAIPSLLRQEPLLQSETAHLRWQLEVLERQEGRLLELYLEEQLDSPAIRTRLADLKTRRITLTDGIKAPDTKRVAQAAQTARQEAESRGGRLPDGPGTGDGTGSARTGDA
jgi:hypothetical protein